MEGKGARLSENEKAPASAGALLIATLLEALVQLVRDVAERAVQLGAEALHDGDDRDRDAGSDQAVFDGRRARLVLGKALKGLHG